MSEACFFNQPLTFYHGRVPFIVVDLLKELTRLDAGNSNDLFDSRSSDSRLLKRLVKELNNGRVSDWSKYEDIGTLSMTLLEYIDTVTTDDPLIDAGTRDTLCGGSLDPSSSTAVGRVRKEMAMVYPGSYRTILAITEFLKDVETVTNDQLFDIFGLAFFGKDGMKGKIRSSCKKLFHLLMVRHSEVFAGAVLGSAAYLTPKQIRSLGKKIEKQQRRDLLRTRPAVERVTKVEPPPPVQISPVKYESSTSSSGPVLVSVSPQKRRSDDEIVLLPVDSEEGGKKKAKTVKKRKLLTDSDSQSNDKVGQFVEDKTESSSSKPKKKKRKHVHKRKSRRYDHSSVEKIVVPEPVPKADVSTQTQAPRLVSRQIDALSNKDIKELKKELARRQREWEKQEREAKRGKSKKVLIQTQQEHHPRPKTAAERKARRSSLTDPVSVSFGQ